jgi:hypothetical protein
MNLTNLRMISMEGNAFDEPVPQQLLDILSSGYDLLEWYEEE